MARIKFGSLVSSIDGSLGGHTLQRNAYGYSIRNKPIPTKSQSFSQRSIRALIVQVVQLWNTLSVDEQNNFNRFLSYSPDFAWSNPTSMLSGYNLFVKWNFYLLQGTGAMRTDFQYSPAIVPQLAPIVTRSGASLVIVLNSSSLDSSYMLVVRVSSPLKAINSNYKSSLRYLGSFSLTAVPINITAVYLETFGYLPSSGDNIAIGITLVVRLSPIIFAESVYVNQI